MKISKRIIALAAVAVGAVSVCVSSMADDKRNFALIKAMNVFFSVVRELDATYVDQIDYEKLINSALDGMLSSLDPYTQYIPEEDSENFKMMITGEYGGVGSVISLSDTNFIMLREIYNGAPAHKAGLKAGDLIIRINGKDASGMSVSQVSSELRGKQGTNTDLLVLRNRNEKPFPVSVKRETIQISPVPYYGMLNSEVGYIAFDNFTVNCAEILKDAYIDLKENHGAKKMVLDLRGNVGGLLDEAIEIVNLFVPKGSDVLVTKGKVSNSNKIYKAMREPIDTETPLVVMISRLSASASEIVAGALQDLDRAVIVGRRSFGKGLVQATRQLDYNSALKLTSAKYYIPSGRCVQALDYSHRDENGAVGYVPDSLISEFKTKGGRSVYDGGGVSPDIQTTYDDVSNISVALYVNDISFRYATRYSRTHATVAKPSEFKLTDAEYADFCRFVHEQKKFTYTNKSQTACDKMVEAAKREGYYESNKQLIDSLSAAMKPNLDADLQMSRSDIEEDVSTEIMRQYYYKEGAIEYMLRFDSEAKVVTDLFNDMPRYYGILDGSVPSHAGDKRLSNSVK